MSVTLSFTSLHHLRANLISWPAPWVILLHILRDWNIALLRRQAALLQALDPQTLSDRSLEPLARDSFTPSFWRQVLVELLDRLKYPLLAILIVALDRFCELPNKILPTQVPIR